MSIRIEDEFVDIIGKARSGLGLTQADLAERTGMDTPEVRALFKGEDSSSEAIQKLAQALCLDPKALSDAYPAPEDPGVDAPDGLIRVNTPYPVPGYAEMTVNAYIVHTPGSTDAIGFDGGAEAPPFLKVLERERFSLLTVFLTHAHGDHIQALDGIRKVVGTFPLRGHEAEAPAGADSFIPPQTWNLGGLEIEAKETHGHSPGGTTYIVRGLSKPVAIVGDALFCGSIGGVKGDYDTALQQIRDNILSLPDETVLCPGHGPYTTVAHEKAHNPFFATQYRY